MEIDKEILKGHIDTILLSLLRSKTMYGYELARLVREKSEDKFELKEATMYLALKRLEKGGFIESFWSDGNSGGGRRRYYRILPSGQQKCHAKQQEWKFMKEIFDTFYGGDIGYEAN